MALPLRLLVGLFKGLVVGGLIGFALSAAGMGLPGAWLAYPMAALVGALLALVAGKPIWAEGARIEVGAKAVAGLILAPLLMAASRHFLTVDVSAMTTEGATLGMASITSLAMVGALVAGFFEADNSPEPSKTTTGAGGPRIGGTARIEASSDDLAEIDASEAEARQQRHL